MSFRVLSPTYAMALVLGATSLLMVQVQGQPQQTNATSVAERAPASPPKDRLKDLEDELSKALESFSPKGMLEGKPEPQFQPPVLAMPTKRQKEERDKRKNWMLMEPDDLLRDSPSSDWLNPFATKDDKKKTELDLFYERLNQQRSILNQKSRLNPDDMAPLSNSALSDDSTSANDDQLPDIIKGPAGKLRDLLGLKPAAVTAPRNSLSEFFAPNHDTLTPEQVQAHKNLMDEYRKILAGTPPAATPLGSVAGGSSQAPSLPGGLPGSSPSTLPATPGMVGSVYNPTIMPDHNSTVLNQWNPLYSPPKIEPPKPPPLIDPPIEAPRRKF